VTFTDLTPAVTGPAQNVDWKWVFGDGQELHSATNAQQPHCYNNTTSNQVNTYGIKLVVTTDKGCTDSISKASYITVYPTPIAAYDVAPNPGDVVTPLIYFTNHSVDYTKWWWSFGDGPQLDSTNVDPTHFYGSETADTYQSILIVENQYGCRDEARVKVEILPEFTFYIPNAFTPANNDNINDVFTGKGIGIEHYEMWIFDRWGAMIYYTDDIAKGWNGKVQGKSQEVQQDVYIWKVKLRDVLGKKHEYIGHVTVLR
jgi:gliding motility-associated-like protein